MKAKLIKKSKDHFQIETQNFDGYHLACTPHDVTKQRLSLENCQAIESAGELGQTEWDVIIDISKKAQRCLILTYTKK